MIRSVFYLSYTRASDLPVAEDFRVFSDEVNKFKISIPEGKQFVIHLVHDRALLL